MQTPINKLVIVPCTAQKAPTAMPARSLYLGSYFKASLSYALTVVRPQCIRVASALHGLLDLHEMVEPYEFKLTDEYGPKWVKQIRIQATEQGILEVGKVYVLCPDTYTRWLQQVWPHAKTPLKGLGGSFGVTRTLKHNRGKLPEEWGTRWRVTSLGTRALLKET